MKDWYNSLSTRERNIVLYGSIAVVVILIWLLIIKPLHNKRTRLENSIESQKSALETMQKQSIEVKRLQGQASKKGKPSTGNPQQLIERSLKRWGLNNALERMQSQGSKGVRVSLKDANADRSMQFLYELEYTHLLTVTNLAIDGDDKQNGIADFKITVESVNK